MIKTIIDTYWKSAIVNGESFLRSDTVERVKRARLIVSLFYLFVFITATQTFGVTIFPAWDVLIDSKDLFDPIWSVSWIPLDYWEAIIRTVLLSFLGFSIVALLLWERSRLIRIGLFTSMFVYLSLLSSFGKIDHFMHIMTVVSFLLIFAPVKTKKNSSATDLLRIVFGIQTFILLAYFVSGFFKLYGILDQELRGVTSALSPDALAINLSKTTIANGLDYFGSSLILANPSFFFSVIMIGGFLVEFFSIYVIFKPRLHRVWGVLLMLLHAGILITVGPDFSLQMFVVGLFLVFSPFANLNTDIIGDLKSLWTSISNWFQNRSSENEFVVFYDGDCLMCNGFVTYLAKFDLPAEIRLCKLKSERFEALSAKHPGLKEVDSIIVAETTSAGEDLIRIKANGILWVLAKLKFHFKVLKQAHNVAPFAGNVVYDLIAKNREIPGADHCPMPPEKIRQIIVS